jgi:hypothetical protein
MEPIVISTVAEKSLGLANYRSKDFSVTLRSSRNDGLNYYFNRWQTLTYRHFDRSGEIFGFGKL